ncbi:3-Oxoacyl-(acyl-carrier-protein) synthase III [Oceaniovalibus guishaninsula JLT2003]|uniref:3-Oxoacyl-(Acyl-carrier-protein) synthase III n=1 Tax=Oceaniovalibus guishaninsula JLT2003 TaxID=1231392 RepID=K2H6I7_9RHOB|nr:OB-fold domain-containing protein [Oceaniovalibus guishaninsula]EKE43238.1 3-Oxoacyl-(acyl-carrier-protein) synthase III [Oceaniovalibus guishaninsula JLT2003]
METGLIAYGAYLPVRRLQREVAAQTHAWFNPGLKALARGERAIANWDEDAVTMALEAARNCLDGQDRAALRALWLASTSLPFRDRLNAGIVGDALVLDASVMALDVASSQRAGTTALMAALRGDGPALVVASDRRAAKAGSPQEMTYGDGAAAFLVGRGDLLARLVGAHSETVDFVDHYRGQDGEFDYAWEERWIRDEGHLKIAPRAITALLQATGTDAASIARFCYPAAGRGIGAGIARICGLPESALADTLQSGIGETGAAHPLLMLAHALESAEPGDRILVAGFGQGCDALLFQATDAVRARRAAGVAAQIGKGRADDNYARFVTLNGLLTVEHGIRAELDKGTALSNHWRNKDMTQRMTGGHCTACGTDQFPKARICVNPECGAVDTQRDEGFSHKIGKLNSFTADRLTYSPDPPAYYGMVEFASGGRLMCDFTDIDAADPPQVGMAMRMVFRVKDHDTRRGFRRYFWKAMPATREET